MSSITLKKIELSGYKFISNEEFKSLESYLPGITYFVYVPTKDFTDPEDDRPELETYFMRADRCVKADMDGDLTEIYNITDDSGSIIAQYGTDVTFIYGSRGTERLTIKLPVGDTYCGKLPTRPNTSNLLFVGWTRNGELVTDTTVIKYGDELRARFSIVGTITHPFGPLFSETGKWVVDDYTFTAKYKADYFHASSKLHAYAGAKYTFSSGTLERTDLVVTMELDPVFYTGGVYGVYPVNYGTCNKWFSPYGAAIVQNTTTSEVYIELGHTDSTILSFDPNTPSYYDYDYEEMIDGVDYTGKVTTIYLGKGTGSIKSVQTDGTLRVVRANVGNTSAVSTTTVTWASNDVGTLVLTGTWAYVAMGTTTAQTTSNYDARPLSVVANYACTTLAANGFSNQYIVQFYVSSNLTLVSNGFNVGDSGTISSIVVAASLKPVANGLNGLICDSIFIEKFNGSIPANWAAGAISGYTVTGCMNLIIQTVPAGSSTINLATGTSNFDNVTILDCNVISGTGTSATTTTFATANIKGYLSIRRSSPGNITAGAYAFNALTNKIRMYIDDGSGYITAAALRSHLPTTVYKASSGMIIYSADKLGITYNGTSIANSPIDKVDSDMLNLLNNVREELFNCNEFYEE